MDSTLTNDESKVRDGKACTQVQAYLRNFDGFSKKLFERVRKREREIQMRIFEQRLHRNEDKVLKVVMKVVRLAITRTDPHNKNISKAPKNIL